VNSCVRGSGGLLNIVVDCSQSSVFDVRERIDSFVQVIATLMSSSAALKS
jgi:hypothetical protein